jgi:hypothetical protein
MALLRPSPSSRIIPAQEAWNQTASDDGIFNQRVRLNEAWYNIPVFEAEALMQLRQGSMIEKNAPCGSLGRSRLGD